MMARNWQDKECHPSFTSKVKGAMCQIQTNTLGFQGRQIVMLWVGRSDPEVVFLHVRHFYRQGR